MKNFSDKKILVFSTFLVFSMFILIFAFAQNKSPTQVDTQIKPTVFSTIFAPTKDVPAIELRSAQAKENILTIILSVSGLEVVKTPDDFENIICNPYIRIKEPIQLTLNFREGEIPDRIGEPIIITYEYGMDPKEYKSLSVEIDLTIGPCGQYYEESSVTPYPPVALIANYRLIFTVPVK